MSAKPGVEWTDADLKENFELLLIRALQGKLPHSDSGMSFDVERALADVALAFPNGNQWVQKARETFNNALLSGYM